MSVKSIEKHLKELKEKEELLEEDKNWLIVMGIFMQDKIYRGILDVISDLIDKIDRIEKHIGLDKK